jgi:hypothetical protein
MILLILPGRECIRLATNERGSVLFWTEPLHFEFS